VEAPKQIPRASMNNTPFRLRGNSVNAKFSLLTIDEPIVIGKDLIEN
jgi:hypothetical protein